MGRALGVLHAKDAPAELEGRTASEVENVRRALEGEARFPSPFGRVSKEAIAGMLDSAPEPDRRVVTHGSPVVAAAILVDSVVTFETAGTEGFDPPERDLAISIRSIAETFTSEVARTFLEGYEEEGGQLPRAHLLDWYGLLAAFR